ncbi:MAG: replication factor C small subunit [Candidatus Diapherotrites archaeon]|nr:replication factor C small subunit [Candidatus Diapherotrites archaeon]
MNPNLELPWVEKYRPKKLNEVVGQKIIVQRLKEYVNSKNMPHMMFAGPAGCGKTSCAVALAKEMYTDHLEQNFLELNASDTRGIDVVRGQIKDFARTLAFNAQHKVIFLDEADSLTNDAQHALRRTMEKYTKTARFILNVNYSSRIIEPIQSRCIVFRFSRLQETDLNQKLNEIAKAEQLELDEKALKAIAYISDGDLRKATNALQGASILGKKISEESIFNVSSRAKPVEIKEMILLALEQKFLDVRNRLDKLMLEHGMSGEDVMVQVYKETLDLDETILDTKKKIELVNIIGEYNFRLVQGANERIQLEALMAQFMKFGNKS